MDELKKFEVREADIVALVKEAIFKEHGGDDGEITIKGIVDHGGSSGVVIRVQVTGKQTYDLVVKHSMASELIRKVMPMDYLYAAEIAVYSRLVPSLNDLSTKRPLTFLPKFYTAKIKLDREILVLEDLTPQGYSLLDIRKPVTEDCIKMLLDAYAHWHSTCLVFNQEYPGVWQDIIEDLNSCKSQIFTAPGSEFIDGFHTTLCNLLRNNGQTELLEKVKNYNYKDFLANSIKNDEYSVVVHDDCWMNNFMFKFDGNRPKSVKIIDWQIAGSGYLQSDLATLLLSVVLPEDYDKIDGYLNLYYELFNDYLTDLGYSAKDVYPRDVFDGHWKEMAKYGLIRAPFHFTKFLGSDDKPSHIINSVQNDNVISSLVYATEENNDLVAERTIKLLRYMNQKDLL